MPLSMHPIMYACMQTDGVASASMSASASTSYRQPMPPARPVDALVVGPRKLRQSHAEEEPGRMPSYVIKDLFEQRNRLLLADFEKEMQHVVSV